MECVPDLAFLQMAAATNNEMLTKMMWAGGSGAGTTMKQRKTNFTSREVEALLNAVSDRKDTVLFGVAGGLGWARAWHEVAQQVSAIEGIHRSESDVRKKWTYLKWEAKNTSKPGRDPTSRAVLEILTSKDRGETSSSTPTPTSIASSNSLLEQLLGEAPNSTNFNPMVTENGNKKLCYGGYMYTKKYVKSNRIRWECSKRRSLGCKGAATSNLSNEDIRESVLHSHEPDNMSVEIEKLKARMKDRIKTSGAKPSQVLAEVLQSSAELIAEMGKIESLKRNLRRQRQAISVVCEPDSIETEEYDSDCSEVPQTGGGGQVGQSPGGGSPGPAPVPAVKKVVAAPPPAPAAPPEVCLRWNSYHSNMQATFPSLLNNEQFVDVTLACEGRSIKCHKVMLSACSSYFEELLSQNPCQHPIIFMRDLKFWEVQALVEFMYTGEVNVAQDKLPSLLTAAEALQIKGLTNPGGGGGGGSTGSYAASQEDDSNTTPDIDDVSSPSYCPPAKKIRKRKATNPTSYHQKAQAVYSPVTQQGSPISSPMLHQVAAPPALTPMRMMSQPNIGIPQIASHATSQSAPAAHSTSQPPAAHPGTLTATVQSRPSQPRIKKEPGSPPHSYLPPPHPPFTHVIKSEPDDNMDTLLDLSESESRKESNAVQPPEEPLSLATNDQGPSSNGSQSKAQDNGLSEDETGSDCSESQSMHIDPGETSDA